MATEVSELWLEQEKQTRGKHLQYLTIAAFLIGGLGVFRSSVYFVALYHEYSTDPGKMFHGGGGGFFHPTGGALFLLGVLLLGYLLMPFLQVGMGVFLLRRVHRIPCIVVAALSCLDFPFGTGLGIAALMVLNQTGTKVLFGEWPFAVSLTPGAYHDRYPSITGRASATHDMSEGGDMVPPPPPRRAVDPSEPQRNSEPHP